jgi:hypothetical protein
MAMAPGVLIVVASHDPVYCRAAERFGKGAASSAASIPDDVVTAGPIPRISLFERSTRCICN